MTSLHTWQVGWEAEAVAFVVAERALVETLREVESGGWSEVSGGGGCGGGGDSGGGTGWSCGGSGVGEVNAAAQRSCINRARGYEVSSSSGR